MARSCILTKWHACRSFRAVLPRGKDPSFADGCRRSRSLQTNVGATKSALIRSLAKSHQREVAERLYRSPFHNAISGPPGPGIEPCEGKLHSPAQMADQGGEAVLICAP